jgi:uncharacterized protein YcgI (DUF1989 family)
VSDEGYAVVLSQRIEPKAAFAWTCPRGSLVRITDLEGKQVGDLVLFALDNLRERISISWTRTRNLRDTATYVPPLGLTAGDRIFSTGYRVMATVIEDTPEPKGIHDLFGRMCNRGMYELYGVEAQPGCFELLQNVLAPHGISPEEIPDPLGVFMHTVPHPDTRVMEIHEPVSRAGDRLVLRAEMDLLAAMSTCPMDVIAPTNGWRITPMLVEVLEPERGR